MRQAGKGARSVAVVGGGWAGCAAAVALARGRCRVTLFEASRTLGGRARRVDSDGRALDNGQHILLGAYRDSLALLKRLGVARGAALLTLPLQMRYAPGAGGMDFVAPRLPAPLHLFGALLRATGLAREDKLSLARFSTTARWMGWRLHDDCSVSTLLERFEQTPRLIQLMWRPLCLAALNTPPERASAQVFLNVLRDSLGAGRSASDMLLPRTDLSALLPDAAAAYVLRHGGAVHMGVKVGALARAGAQWRVEHNGDNPDDTTLFDGVVVATGWHGAASLLRTLADDDDKLHATEAAALAATCAQLDAFDAEAITTCYLQYGPDVRLAQPFFALIDDPEQGHWGQFVFDRGQLIETAPTTSQGIGQRGLLAVVVSASAAASAQGQAALVQAVASQLAHVFGRAEFAQPLWTKVISEKRATYACAPGLARPANATILDGLVLAGDYTADADPLRRYPATLEGAVRSGNAAARLLGGRP